MKRFRFRFQKLLEIRKYRKRSAEEAFANSLREWQDAELKAEQAGRLAQEALRKIETPGVYSVWQVGQGIRYATMLRERWQEQLHHARVLKGKVDEARRRLIEATREHQILEKLKSKHHETYQAEEALEQQKLLDDLSTIGYIRSQHETRRDRQRGEMSG